MRYFAEHDMNSHWSALHPASLNIVFRDCLPYLTNLSTPLAFPHIPRMQTLLANQKHLQLIPALSPSNRVDGAYVDDLQSYRTYQRNVLTMA